LYDSRASGKDTEDGFLSAHCRYVVSKWAGENYLNEDDLIIRPRLLFDGGLQKGRNNLLQKLPKFNDYLDEFNSVTSCDTIVEAVEALLESNCRGAFNVANDGAYTIHDMAEALGYNGGYVSQEELHQSQGLFLVNNVMDLTKLKRYYQPTDTIEELLRCNRELNKNIH
jgi:nucleoside-diphosphate-sugar epimerase